MTNVTNEILNKKRAEIVKEWFLVVVETYPAETAKFIKGQKDPFANPVGKAVRNGVEDLFDELVRGLDRDTAGAYLDPMIRIRAIQNFTPSEAVGFVFSLKSIIRKILSEEIRDKKIAVVGSGPAGLTVAYYLRLKGYQITIFEALKELEVCCVSESPITACRLKF